MSVSVPLYLPRKQKRKEEEEETVVGLLIISLMVSDFRLIDMQKQMICDM